MISSRDGHASTAAVPAEYQAVQPTIHPATFRSLRVEMRSGDRPISVGTAFIVRSPVGHLLITSRQNVTGRDALTNELFDERGATPDRLVVWHHLLRHPLHWRPVTQALVDRCGKPLWIEHPVLGARGDIVALRLLERIAGALDALSLHPHELACNPVEREPAPSDKVSIIGFPLDLRVAGFLPVWAAGYIASEPDLDVDDLPVFLVDCRGHRGQLGSPVVSTAGPPGSVRLLGVYGGRAAENSDIGRVWKTSALVDLQRSVVPNFGHVVLNGSVAQTPDWLDYAGDIFDA